MGVEYDGTGYNGWQIQSHAPSLQASLNAAVSRVAAEAVTCIGAGRTDTATRKELRRASGSFVQAVMNVLANSKLL